MATGTNSNQKPSMYLQNKDEVEKVFNRFDTNGDGKISADELKRVLKALGSDTSAEEVERMMSEMDTDKDGFINLQEFATFCDGKSDPYAATGEGNNGEKELMEAFQLYDQDKNGLISGTELHQILTLLGEKVSVADCGKMIQSVDADGDGFVNFEEFKKMMTNNK